MTTETTGPLTQSELDLLIRGAIPAQRTRRSKQRARKLIIRTMFAKWTLFYQMAMRSDINRLVQTKVEPLRMTPYLVGVTDPTMRATLIMMNCGDYGTTAIAVGQSLELLGFDVAYCDLGGHACLLIDGLYYDALVPNGTKEVAGLLGYSFEKQIETGDATILHNAYLPYDELGTQLAETFVRMLSLTYRYPFTIQT